MGAMNFAIQDFSIEMSTCALTHRNLPAKIDVGRMPKKSSRMNSVAYMGMPVMWIISRPLFPATRWSFCEKQLGWMEPRGCLNQAQAFITLRLEVAPLF